MDQLTKEQAIRFAKEEMYTTMNHRQIAEFQIEQTCLCMPFSVFHEAMEKTLGRPVYTHEFGLNLDGLKAELFFDAPAPTLDQIIELIPAEKRFVLKMDES